MLIIAGLGNPGKEYENTRHNAGFMVMDALAEKIGADISEKKHKALCGKGVIGGEKAIFLVRLWSGNWIYKLRIKR